MAKRHPLNRPAATPRAPVLIAPTAPEQTRKAPDSLRADHINRMLRDGSAELSGEGLGWWGHPYTFADQPAVAIASLFVWKVPPDGKLPNNIHIAMGHNIVLESTWEWKVGKSLCFKGPGYEFERKMNLETWMAAVPLLPKDYEPKAEIPPVQLCARCCRMWLIALAQQEAMQQMIEEAVGRGDPTDNLGAMRMVHAGTDILFFGDSIAEQGAEVVGTADETPAGDVSGTSGYDPEDDLRPEIES